MTPSSDPPITDDRRARKILFDTYWTSAGWRSSPVTAPADLEYATAAGYMIPRRAGSHDEWIRWASEARDQVPLTEVMSAFVASLGGRRLALRSALGSLASVRNLDRHEWRPWSAHCGDCGIPDRSDQDLNVLNFERHKWGGVRHGSPIYAWLDLTLFARTERAVETDKDIEILNDILDAARRMPPDARPRDLERAIAPIVASSKAEREVILEILALWDVLAPRENRGLLAEWVPYEKRQPPPRPSKNDWHYPMFWWRGAVGVNEAAAHALFGDRLK